MCGIGGSVGLDDESTRALADLFALALAHRGPDGSGTAFPEGLDVPVGLAHTRLAVIDPTGGGAQPMRREGAGGAALWVSYNGELYNYRELRDELRAAGETFATESDTEVLLAAYAVWGEGFVERLRGMFAFALVDEARGKALLARDRLGIKPLYVARAGEALLFASEVRALGKALRSVGRPPSLNPAALGSFLAQGAVLGTATHLAEVEALAPGSLMVLDRSGRVTGTRRYWALEELPVGTRPADGAYRSELAETLRAAVRGHLVSDVPLGLFLSSGIDSTALATLATDDGEADVRTLGIGFDVGRFDESEGAAAIAAALGTTHRTETLAAADVLAGVEAVFDAMDQPTVDGFNTFFVSRAARRSGLTVALSGVGGDELFGGYASFRDVPKALALRRALGPAAGLLGRLPLGALSARSRALAKGLALLRRPPSMAEAYLLRRELSLPDERLLLWPAGSASPSGVPGAIVAAAERRAGRAADAEGAVSLLELSLYMRDMLLRDADVFSMANQLELRVPLVDHEVVELALAAEGAAKRGGDPPKPLLVEAAGGRFPRAILARKKRGFTFPWESWFRGPLAPALRERLGQRETWKDLGIAPAAPLGLVERFQDGDRRVPALLLLALWVLAELRARGGLG
ncbi:MAG: asparagine synthase (glutamine-hydrolyzing) [Myxococcota bacterium]